MSATTFDWATFDKVCAELDSVCLAMNSYHDSLNHLEQYGWDEHGVYPGEGQIYQRKLNELTAQLNALGTPPFCTQCRGRGEYYRYQDMPDGDRYWDEYPSTCWRCGGTGEYEGGD